jgi:hypothetical protein
LLHWNHVMLKWQTPNRSWEPETCEDFCSL